MIEWGGTLFSFVFPPAFATYLHATKSRFYTGYWRRHFLLLGEGTVIAYKAEALQGLKMVKVGERVAFGRHLRLTAWNNDEGVVATPKIEIGDNCHFGERNHITASNLISVGRNILTGSNVLITDNAHGFSDKDALMTAPIERDIVSKGGVFIGDNVWLGNNVCVMPGVSIGDGAIVGANSVVTKDIPAYSVAVGCPAQAIRTT